MPIYTSLTDDVREPETAFSVDLPGDCRSGAVLRMHAVRSHTDEAILSLAAQHKAQYTGMS